MFSYGLRRISMKRISMKRISMNRKFKKWLVNNFTNINKTKTWAKNWHSQKYII